MGAVPIVLAKALSLITAVSVLSKKFKKCGYHTIMINSNPETVSTDYDTADELYFEPLVEEYVLETLKYVNPQFFCSQFGGQTALELVRPALFEGFQMIGSSMKSIDLAEDRMQFARLCRNAGFQAPQSGGADSLKTALKVAEKIGIPIDVPPQLCAGGRRMEIIHTEEELVNYFEPLSVFYISCKSLFD